MRGGVLFLMGTSGIGGVERVSVVLANEFAARGVRVCFCMFELLPTNLIGGLNAAVKVVELKKDWVSRENCTALRRVLVENGIAYIVNQWCVPFKVTWLCRRAAKGLGIKLYAVHHNIPTTNLRIQRSTGWRRKLWQLVTAVNLRLVYECSDAYVLLSASFVDLFRQFVWVRTAAKVKVIANPLTLKPLDRAKENIILYVGRLEETQKRVSRVIEIWKALMMRLPDWRLEIVGDGPDRALYENAARDVDRISFVGFQDPSAYYAHAKMLVLTSDFEGFGLVLVEAMASGCVPIVLGSYPSAYDFREGAEVIDMPYGRERFEQTIFDLANSREKWQHAQQRALKTAERYSVKAIADMWFKLFEGE